MSVPRGPLFHNHQKNYILKCVFNSSQEKAILSTQMLKLEGNLKELKAKLTGFDKDHLIQV